MGDLGSDGFYAPMGYSTIWLVIGGVILAAVVGWALVVWWQTRPAPPPKPAPPPPPGWLLQRLKGDYLERIDEIVRVTKAGELTERRGHQELSATVRQFVQEASGISAPTMTLTDLGRSGVAQLEPVADVVVRLYPGEFGPDSGTSAPNGPSGPNVADAAHAAREVVGRWT